MSRMKYFTPGFCKKLRTTELAESTTPTRFAWFLGSTESNTRQSHEFAARADSQRTFKLLLGAAWRRVVDTFKLGICQAHACKRRILFEWTHEYLAPCWRGKLWSLLTVLELVWVGLRAPYHPNGSLGLSWHSVLNSRLSKNCRQLSYILLTAHVSTQCCLGVNTRSASSQV